MSSPTPSSPTRRREWQDVGFHDRALGNYYPTDQPVKQKMMAMRSQSPISPGSRQGAKLQQTSPALKYTTPAGHLATPPPPPPFAAFPRPNTTTVTPQRKVLSPMRAATSGGDKTKGKQRQGKGQGQGQVVVDGGPLDGQDDEGSPGALPPLLSPSKEGSGPIKLDWTARQLGLSKVDYHEWLRRLYLAPAIKRKAYTPTLPPLNRPGSPHDEPSHAALPWSQPSSPNSPNGKYYRPIPPTSPSAGPASHSFRQRLKSDPASQAEDQQGQGLAPQPSLKPRPKPPLRVSPSITGVKPPGATAGGSGRPSAAGSSPASGLASSPSAQQRQRGGGDEKAAEGEHGGAEAEAAAAVGAGAGAGEPASPERAYEAAGAVSRADSVSRRQQMAVEPAAEPLSREDQRSKLQELGGPDPPAYIRSVLLAALAASSQAPSSSGVPVDPEAVLAGVQEGHSPLASLVERVFGPTRLHPDDITSLDADLLSPLHIAAAVDDVWACKVLVERCGASPDLMVEQDTPLSVAVASGAKLCARYLVGVGAKPIAIKDQGLLASTIYWTRQELQSQGASSILSSGQTSPPPLLLGVRLSWLLSEFGPQLAPGLTWAQAAAQVVLPATQPGTPYSGLLPAEACGPPQHYVIHAWAAPVAPSLAALQRQMEALYGPGEAAMQAMLWLDVLCSDLHARPAPDSSSSSCTTPTTSPSYVDAVLQATTSHAVLIMDESLQVLSRLWCLFEAWRALQLKGPQGLLLAARDVDLPTLPKRFACLDVRDAGAESAADRYGLLLALLLPEPCCSPQRVSHKLRAGLADSAQQWLAALKARKAQPGGAQPSPEAMRDALQLAARMALMSGQWSAAEGLLQQALDAMATNNTNTGNAAAPEGAAEGGGAGDTSSSDAPSGSTWARLNVEYAQVVLWLGRLDDAIQAAQRARMACSQVHGEDSEHVALTMALEARVLGLQGKHHDASTLCELALEMVSGLDKLSPNRMEIQAVQTEMQLDQGVVHGVHVKQYMLSRTMTIKDGDERDQQIAGKVLHTGLTAQMYMLTAEVEKAYEGAVACREAADLAMGPDHPGACNAYRTQAMMLSRYLGMHREAELLLRKVVEVRLRVLGPQHPQTGLSQTSLAQVLARQQRTKEADALGRQGMQVLDSMLGPSSSIRARALLDYVTVLLDQARYKEAEAACRSALSTFQALDDPDNLNTIAALQQMARVQVSQGQVPEARHSLELAQEIVAKLFRNREENAITAEGLAITAQLMQAEGKPWAALDELQHSIAMREERSPVISSATGLRMPDLEGRAALMELCLQLGRSQQYQALVGPSGLQRYVDPLLRGGDPLGLDLHYALGPAALAYARGLLVLGQHRSGTALLRQLISWREQVHGPGHISTVEPMVALAQAMLEGGEAGATAMLERAVSIAAAEWGMEHPRVGALMMARALALKDDDSNTAEAMAQEAVNVGTARMGEKHPRVLAMRLQQWEVMCAAREVHTDTEAPPDGGSRAATLWLQRLPEAEAWGQLVDAAEDLQLIDLRVEAYLAAAQYLYDGDRPVGDLAEMAGLAAATMQAFPAIYQVTHPSFVKAHSLLAYAEGLASVGGKAPAKAQPLETIACRLHSLLGVVASMGLPQGKGPAPCSSIEWDYRSPTADPFQALHRKLTQQMLKQGSSPHGTEMYGGMRAVHLYQQLLYVLDAAGETRWAAQVCRLAHQLAARELGLRHSQARALQRQEEQMRAAYHECPQAGRVPDDWAEESEEEFQARRRASDAALDSLDKAAKAMAAPGALEALYRLALSKAFGNHFAVLAE